MRVSDFVIDFLKSNYGVDTIFTVSGGGCIFLIDSLSKIKGVDYIPTHHEQSAAIAAEGYSRINNSLGACIVTSGPGGTNTLTGVLCSWLDSIPVIIISGQVNKNLTTNYTGLNLRQLGDQEFNIVETVQNMTKYAVQVNDPNEIKYHLEKACKLATTGRPGPVWLDIPLDVQSSEVDLDELEGYSDDTVEVKPKNGEIQHVVDKLSKSKKPLLIVGNGVRLSNGLKELYEFLEKTNIPVITAVNGNDIVNEDYEQYYGRFGTHAQICANKLLSECDLLISVGSRLYVRQTGYSFEKFSEQAHKIYVDIDENELNKPTLYPDKKIVSDAKLFLEELNNHSLHKTQSSWLSFCDSLKNANSTVLPKHREYRDGYVSHYHFMETLSENTPNDYHVITSNGSANVVTMQVLKLKGEQRLITNTGAATMGYGLPASIGASIHHKVLCIEGDGSIHMNIQELETLKNNRLPVKLLILNNDGYVSIKLTQNSFFGGKYVASEKNSGVTLPNFEKLITAYDIPYDKITKTSEMKNKLSEFFSKEGPCVLEVFTDPNEYHEPKVFSKLDENNKFIPGELKDIKWLD